jgi:hypothetical protein
VHRKSRAPLITTIALGIVILVGFFSYRSYDGRMRESLSPHEVTVSTAELNSAHAAVQVASKAHQAATTALHAAPADFTVVAAWIQSSQNYEVSLSAFARVLQERLSAEKHLGTDDKRLRLQLSDMQRKLVASSVGGVSFDSLMSAEPNLSSAATDGSQLLKAILQIK